MTALVKRVDLLREVAERLFDEPVATEEVVPRLTASEARYYEPQGSLIGLIDHTALRPETTETEVDQLCAEARRFGFASVCVNPSYVPLAVDELGDADPVVATVVGFPLGATLPAVKAAETHQAIKAGAAEIDVVLNIGWLKSGRYGDVESDLHLVVEAAEGATVKVILETALLTDEEKVLACVLAERAGADYVKTSTGFAAEGATTDDVALMRRIVGDRLGVKASGGVRTYEQAQDLVEHGATRIGSSNSVAIVGQAEKLAAATS